MRKHFREVVPDTLSLFLTKATSERKSKASCTENVGPGSSQLALNLKWFIVFAAGAMQCRNFILQWPDIWYESHDYYDRTSFNLASVLTGKQFREVVPDTQSIFDKGYKQTEIKGQLLRESGASHCTTDSDSYLLP